jgi:1-acyl-sn-glycerol-3-phosphate acyltransferase
LSDVITPETVPLPQDEPVTFESAALSGPPEVDDFGRDPAFEARALQLLEPIYRRYFRVEVRGLEHLPATGPVILVANHSGALPWDVAMLKAAVALDHPSRRALRPLIENFLFHFPFLGVALNRFGAVRACQENAEALLEAGEAIAVFPEGAKGLGKTIRKRYQLQRFGRGGFIKLALRTGAPIVPVAIVGAEETHPLLARLTRPAAPLGLPFLPVTPTFPLLGPAGLLPLPTKWTIEFAPMMGLGRNPSADELTIERLTEDVRAGIQGQLDRLTRTRRSIFG